MKAGTGLPPAEKTDEEVEMKKLPQNRGNKSYLLQIAMAVVWFLTAGGSVLAFYPDGLGWAMVSGSTNAGDASTYANPSNCGSVAYDFQMMSNEVTFCQYNAYTNLPTGASNEPARYVSCYEVMRFCDWVTTSSPVVFTGTVIATRLVDATKTNLAVWFTNFLSGVYCTNWLSLTNLLQHGTLTNWSHYIESPPVTNWLATNYFSDTNFTYEFAPFDMSMSWSNWVRITTNYVYLVPDEDEWYKAAYFCINRSVAIIDDYYARYPNTRFEVDTNDFTFLRGTNGILSVGAKTGRSSYGVCDMGGNVWEWIEPNTNMPGAPAGCAIIRGGSYFSRNGRDLSSSCREFHSASNGVAGIGFRMIRIRQN